MRSVIGIRNIATLLFSCWQVDELQIERYISRLIMVSTLHFNHVVSIETLSLRSIVSPLIGDHLPPSLCVTESMIELRVTEII